MSVTPGQVSADGRWRWDGRQWMPASAMEGQVPPPPQGYAPAAPTNNLAIVSLVAGILCWVVFPIAGALVAIIAGHIARGQIRRTGEGGKGLALVGLILGYVHLVVATVVGIVWVAFVAGFAYTLFSNGSH